MSEKLLDKQTDAMEMGIVIGAKMMLLKLAIFIPTEKRKSIEHELEEKELKIWNTHMRAAK